MKFAKRYTHQKGLYNQQLSLEMCSYTNRGYIAYDYTHWIQGNRLSEVSAACHILRTTPASYQKQKGWSQSNHMSSSSFWIVLHLQHLISSSVKHKGYDIEFVPTFLRKTITEQLSNSFFIACPHIFLLVVTSKLCTLWKWVSETWACLELKDWWEAWLSAWTWKIIPSKWQMKKCSASSQSGRYLDRQFPRGDEWKGSSAETKGWNVSSKL